MSRSRVHEVCPVPGEICTVASQRARAAENVVAFSFNQVVAPFWFKEFFVNHSNPCWLMMLYPRLLQHEP
eukprot:6223229-Amphidinium_carterae.1